MAPEPSFGASSSDDIVGNNEEEEDDSSAASSSTPAASRSRGNSVDTGIAGAAAANHGVSALVVDAVHHHHHHRDGLYRSHAHPAFSTRSGANPYGNLTPAASVDGSVASVTSSTSSASSRMRRSHHSKFPSLDGDGLYLVHNKKKDDDDPDGDEVDEMDLLPPEKPQVSGVVDLNQSMDGLFRDDHDHDGDDHDDENHTPALSTSRSMGFFHRSHRAEYDYTTETTVAADSSRRIHTQSQPSLPFQPPVMSHRKNNSWTISSNNTVESHIDNNRSTMIITSSSLAGTSADEYSSCSSSTTTKNKRHNSSRRTRRTYSTQRRRSLPKMGSTAVEYDIQLSEVDPTDPMYNPAGPTHTQLEQQQPQLPPQSSPSSRHYYDSEDSTDPQQQPHQLCRQPFPESPERGSTVTASSRQRSFSESSVYKAEGEEALNYLWEGLQRKQEQVQQQQQQWTPSKEEKDKNKNNPYSNHYPTAPAVPPLRQSAPSPRRMPPPPSSKRTKSSRSLARRNTSTGTCSSSASSTAPILLPPPPLSASKRFVRSTSTSSEASSLKNPSRRNSKNPLPRRRRRERPYYGLSNRSLRRSTTTSATTVTESFAIKTLEPAPPPVYLQYIHDRVNGLSCVPRFKRENLKNNRNKNNKRGQQEPRDGEPHRRKSSTKSRSSASSGYDLDYDEDGGVSKEGGGDMDFASEGFVINNENVSGVFRSILSYADSDLPDNEDEDEDPTDCKNRPPHFLCYLPPCVARWPHIMEQNRICEYVGRIGLHQGFKNKRIARRRIFAVGFTFNLFSLILVTVCSMAASRDYSILSHTGFAKGVATIPNHPPYFVEYRNASLYEHHTHDVTQVATLYMGFRAITSDDGILVDPQSVLFTKFCRGYGLTSVSSRNVDSEKSAQSQKDAFREALAPDICGSCSQSSQGFIISVLVNWIIIVKNMLSDVTRMYPKYDTNCPNFTGSLMALLSVFLGLYTILSYRSRCFSTLTKDLSDFGFLTMEENTPTMDYFDSALFLIPEEIRQNWQGYEDHINVHLEWEAGPGLWCMWIATGLKVVDAICNFVVPTPSITRDYFKREDYEYEYGEPGKFVDNDNDDEEDDDDDDEHQEDDDDEEDDLDRLEKAATVMGSKSTKDPQDDETVGCANHYTASRDEEILDEPDHHVQQSGPPKVVTERKPSGMVLVDAIPRGRRSHYPSLPDRLPSHDSDQRTNNNDNDPPSLYFQKLDSDLADEIPGGQREQVLSPAYLYKNVLARTNLRGKNRHDTIDANVAGGPPSLAADVTNRSSESVDSSNVTEEESNVYGGGEVNDPNFDLDRSTSNGPVLLLQQSILESGLVDDPELLSTPPPQEKDDEAGDQYAIGTAAAENDPAYYRKRHKHKRGPASVTTTNVLTDSQQPVVLRSPQRVHEDDEPLRNGGGVVVEELNEDCTFHSAVQDFETEPI